MGPVAGASTVTHSQSVRAEAVARNAIRHLAIGQHGTDQRVSGHMTEVKGLTDVTSTNWSGYADTGSNYNKVTGNWPEPSVTCSGTTTALAAFWVGIDGYSSDSVEQDGTLAECYEGTLYSFSWWEMYPTNDIQVVGESVAAGDVISASVVRTGASYALKVTDSTHTANSFSTTQTCSGTCANTSAEWIAEAPSGSSGVYPLPDFHTWSLSAATVSTTTASGVISSFPDVQITMKNGSTTKATPSALNAAGNAFSVAWNHS